MLNLLQNKLRSAFFSFILAFFAWFQPAAAQWELINDKNEFGEDLLILEQLGFGGTFFSLVCFDGGINVELFYPDLENEPIENANILLGVLGFEPIRISGFTDRVDPENMFFAGIDLRGNPAQGTEILIQQMTQGEVMGLIVNDPTTGEYTSVEEWDLFGVSEGLRTLINDCV